MTAPQFSTIPGNPVLARFALLNDCNFLITTAIINAFTNSNSYIYSTGQGRFFNLGSMTATPTNSDGIGAGLIASLDGATAIVTHAVNTGLNNVPRDMKYSAEKGRIDRNVQILQWPDDQAVALDATGEKIVSTDGSSTFVGSLGLIDTSGFGRVRAVVVNPLGTRAYLLTAGLEAPDPLLLTYDIGISPTGTPAFFPQVLAGVSQPIPSFNSEILRTVITPDGATIFIAGDTGVEVVPAPREDL